MDDKREKDARIASERPVHCWADGPEETILFDDETGAGDEGQWWGRVRSIGSTCMLPDGHPGPHQFTPDDEITVEFRP